MSFLGSGNTGCSFNIKTLNMCVCACVCLCVLGRTHKGARERESERQQSVMNQLRFMRSTCKVWRGEAGDLGAKRDRTCDLFLINTR